MNLALKKSKSTVVVGLDFGTTFSGFAYALTSVPEEVHKYYEWPSLGEAGGRHYCKTQTSLLYEAGETPRTYVLKNWGYPALVSHSRTRLRPKRIGTLGPEKSSDESSQKIATFFLTRFKLLLATDDHKSSAPDLPIGLTPRRVISDFLREMGKFIITVLRKDIGDHIDVEDVQWCLTVPAIWDERGKQEMRICAEIAGLVDGPDCAVQTASPHPLIISLEPEAASIYCQRKVEFQCNAGERFLVVDVGGGTVDLVLHEKVGPPSSVKVKEVSPSSGGLCGGTFADKNFFKFLCRKICCFQTFAEAHPASVLKLKGWWEEIKYSFDGNMHFPYDLELPSRLARAWEEAESRSPLSTREASASHDAIELSLVDMKSIFDPVIDEILGLIEQKLMHDLCAMVIVGGFAGSPYLKRRIKESFSSRVGEIIVPNEPGCAICCGAVLHGVYGADLILSRISKRTYGIRISRQFYSTDPCALMFQDEDGECHCKDVFYIFTKKGDEVPLDHKASRSFHPVYSYQTETSIELYSTAEGSPKYVSDPGVQKEGAFAVPHPSAKDLGDRPDFLVSMYFGRTTIVIEAQGSNFGAGEIFRMIPVKFEKSFG